MGCRMEPSWFQQYVGEVENGGLQNDLQEFWSSGAGGNSYVELPRGHTKTNTLMLRLAWEIGRNPRIRIKYVGSNETEATKTVTGVKRILESDEFGRVFPEIEPDKDNWGNTSLTVRRGGKSRDQTLEGVPVLGRAGGRSDLLVFDDICDLRNAVMQAASREQVKDFVGTNWLPTRDKANKENPPRTWRIGTPYHVADITADWRKKHGRNGTLFRRPVVDFVSPWSERFTEADMRELREELGPIAYARAYELVPVSSDQLVFPHEWIERSMYSEMSEHVRLTGTRVAAVDFAFSEKTEKKVNPDYSVLLVGMKAMDGTLWVERMWRVRSSFPEFARLVGMVCSQMDVSAVWAEQAGPQRGLVQQLQTDTGVTVIGLERDRDKVSRAHAKQVFVESGRFRVRCKGKDGEREPVDELRELVTELTTFPAAEHDDCVDTAIDLMDACERTPVGSGYSPSMVGSGRPKLWRLRYVA